MEVSHLALALGLAKSSHHLGELGVLFAFLGVIQRISKCSLTKVWKSRSASVSQVIYKLITAGHVSGDMNSHH